MSGGAQRVGFFTALPAFLREMGVDPDPVLVRAGIDPPVLADSENLIPYVAVGALLHESALATGCAHFGLRFGATIRLDQFGVVGRLVRNAPTLGDAITDFADNQHRLVRGAVVYRLVEGSTVSVGYAAYQMGVPALAHVHDVAVLTITNLLRELSGRFPDEVLLPRGPPADPSPWHAAFKVPVRFNGEQAAAVYPCSVLAQPVPGANPALRRILGRVVDNYRAVAEPSVADRVVRLLRPRITLGKTTLSEIAERMRLHPRTLNRRLREEGTSFRDLLNQSRLNVACQMLEFTRLNVTQIGLMLNYADSTVFSHSFRRQTGRTPSDWRARVRQGGAGTTAARKMTCDPAEPAPASRRGEAGSGGWRHLVDEPGDGAEPGAASRAPKLVS